MLARFQLIERLALVAPLGMRFHDAASGVFVGEGLNVSVHSQGSSANKMRAYANRTGVYVLQHAPGLLDFERGSGDADFWRNAPPQKTFVVEVFDEERRFQPFRFTTGLPARGVLNWAQPFGASPVSAGGSIPLYSSPVRHVPAGMAAIRADLWDTSLDAPAAWAVLEAYQAGQLLARGMADDEGRIALIFPYPAPRPFGDSSPPGAVSSPPAAKGPPLTEQVWIITLRAMYSPSRPVASPPEPFATEPALPDLYDALTQPDARLWADGARTQPLTEISLNYGREKILKSQDEGVPVIPSPPPPSTRQSVLFITPAG
jgi:hypothetical protein